MHSHRQQGVGVYNPARIAEKLPVKLSYNLAEEKQLLKFKINKDQSIHFAY